MGGGGEGREPIWHHQSRSLNESVQGWGGINLSLLQAISSVAALVWHRELPCSERCDLFTPPFPLPVQLYTETYAFKEEQELRYFSVTMRAKNRYHGNKRES